VLQQSGILQIQLADRFAGGLDPSVHGTVAQNQWRLPGGSGYGSDGFRHTCQYSTKHFLLGDTFLKTAQGIGGNGIHGQGNLERQRLQLQQVGGSELIVGLDCLVIHFFSPSGRSYATG
jgi:hypothetical protein